MCAVKCVQVCFPFQTPANTGDRSGSVPGQSRTTAGCSLLGHLHSWHVVPYANSRRMHPACTHLHSVSLQMIFLFDEFLPCQGKACGIHYLLKLPRSQGNDLGFLFCTVHVVTSGPGTMRECDAMCKIRVPLKMYLC